MKQNKSQALIYSFVSILFALIAALLQAQISELIVPFSAAAVFFGLAAVIKAIPNDCWRRLPSKKSKEHSKNIVDNQGGDNDENY